jgi:hypothetical protein
MRMAIVANHTIRTAVIHKSYVELNGSPQKDHHICRSPRNGEEGNAGLTLPSKDSINLFGSIGVKRSVGILTASSEDFANHFGILRSKCSVFDVPFEDCINHFRTLRGRSAGEAVLAAAFEDCVDHLWGVVLSIGRGYNVTAAVNHCGKSQIIQFGHKLSIRWSLQGVGLASPRRGQPRTRAAAIALMFTIVKEMLQGLQ